MSVRGLLDKRWRQQILGYGSFACFGGAIIAAMLVFVVASKSLPADGYMLLGILLGPVIFVVSIAGALCGIVITFFIHSDWLLWLLSALTLSMPFLYVVLEESALLGERVDGDALGAIALLVLTLSTWKLLKIRHDRKHSGVA